MRFSLKDKKRIALVIIAVILMGLALSFLNRTKLGGDPFTFMNLGISDRLPISFGTWEAIFNLLLLGIVLGFDRSRLGIGTIANMFLVGYSVDFFTWLENCFINFDFLSSWTMRILVAAPALALFIVTAALYMCCDMGVAPYDGLVYIIHEKLCQKTGRRLPFKFIRMCYDSIGCIIGFLLCGYIGVITICIALFLGPVISMMNEWLKKIL